ncbi:hypothetical protein CEXT_239161 [Caerostris extrusa]|uniref:Uncharacterized protein n=1 Tax=Caerostris extrusa TaxID=172846 RepID=A0AAV4PIX7_CAEEX|nr:hypothetical protein CEXT_239161 [Caerostris extrusa]
MGRNNTRFCWTRMIKDRGSQTPLSQDRTNPLGHLSPASRASNGSLPANILNPIDQIALCQNLNCPLLKFDSLEFKCLSVK